MLIHPKNATLQTLARLLVPLVVGHVTSSSDLLNDRRLRPATREDVPGYFTAVGFAMLFLGGSQDVFLHTKPRNYDEIGAKASRLRAQIGKRPKGTLGEFEAWRWLALRLLAPLRPLTAALGLLCL